MSPYIAYMDPMGYETLMKNLTPAPCRFLLGVATVLSLSVLLTWYGLRFQHAAAISALWAGDKPQKGRANIWGTLAQLPKSIENEKDKDVLVSE